MRFAFALPFAVWRWNRRNTRGENAGDAGGVKLFWESGGGRGPGRRARTSTRAWLGEGTLAAESAPGTGVRGAA